MQKTRCRAGEAESPLASISDAVITTDGAMRIGYIARRWKPLTGLDAKACRRRGGRCALSHGPAILEGREQTSSVKSALHGTVFRRAEPCLLHLPDGSIRYVTDTVSPVLESTGVVSSFVIVFHDSTLEVDRARDLDIAPC